MKRWSTSPEYLAGLRAALARRAAEPPVDDSAEKQVIADWLGRLRLLYGVPFYYVIPDVRMLPQESLRFFQLDENWVTCAIDGAFSIGSSTAGDAASHNAAARAAARNIRRIKLGRGAVATNDTASSPVSGFLLRSAIVSGWPGLEVKAFDGSNAPLELLRFDRLAADILFCLFDGLVAGITLSEPAETLHFGVDLKPKDDGTYTKGLKYVDGSGGNVPGSKMPAEAAVDVPWRDATKRVVDVAALASAIETQLKAKGGMDPAELYTTAEFSLEMVEGVQEGAFGIVFPAAEAKR